MNRLLLRIFTKALLLAGPQRLDTQQHPAGKVGESPFGTMALGRIFDSARTNFSDLEMVNQAGSPGLQPQPAAVIRTDSDQRISRGPNASRPNNSMFYGRVLSLEIEFGLWAKDDDGPGYPALDPRLEALLDLFEFQIEACLRGLHPLAVHWQDLFTWDGWMSEPVWLEDERGRIPVAARRLTMPVLARIDCLPLPRRYDAPIQIPELPPNFDAEMAALEAQAGGDFLLYIQGLRALLATQALPIGSVYPPLLSIYRQIAESQPAEGDPAEVLDEGESLPPPE